MTEDGLHRLELNLHPNEASGLLAVEDAALLKAHGWDLAFWAVLDEGEIEDCVGVIGHRDGAGIGEGWEIERLRAEPLGDAGKTEDAEAITRQGGWIYIFGSHSGGKAGPLQPKRGFAARCSRTSPASRVSPSPKAAASSTSQTRTRASTCGSRACWRIESTLAYRQLVSALRTFIRPSLSASCSLEQLGV
ncbi:MAG TPA: hypothetical protein VFV45_04890 [Rubrobacteraceae bacterium]|nr:hypothetical protein [Rubrobacteraceae bacterium]